ncbi:metallophosphoesterase family protein [Sporosarcina sp. Marseille-Q4063]|uniref:metallophosphoesterase family protein n=1 Tax=Sporosarcina sp. Marseille-Q4063 TaxID=2810514 RepID=UPI001BAEF059|nr:metallophosphoesterase family protein [Sporosarcina sp. Marseille-Q4063]QUW21935.1 metallophosphoesterase family protein [Sporosarcina sp. Marseille-Q4063]
MKFAVITDIHGNAPALVAVLNEIDKRKDIKYIYCLGDMIAIGPDTNAVLELLFSRDDISMITGNHDEAVLATIKDEPHPLSHPHVKEHHEWIAEGIHEKFIDKLDELPRFIRKDISGQSVLFTHYHVESNKVDAHISEDPFAPIVEPSPGNMEALFGPQDVDLICFGHHHPVHFFIGDRTTYLNPGSLGCAEDSVARYAVVTIEVNDIQVELLEAEYDNTGFLMSYEALNVPTRDFILKAFHGDQLKGDE